MRPLPQRQTGFTLIEVMIVVAIAAILASIAWPAYQNQVFRGRRSDAMSALATISQAQERWRSDNISYQATLADLPGGMTVSRGGHYDLSVVSGTTGFATYTIRATVKSSSPQASDLACQTMTMTLADGRITYSSASSGGANDPDTCWVR